MKLILVQLILLFVAISNSFGQQFKNPRFREPLGLMGLGSTNVYLYLILTDSLGIPINLQSYMEKGYRDNYENKYIKSHLVSYTQDEKEVTNYYYLNYLNYYKCNVDTFYTYYSTNYNYKDEMQAQYEYFGMITYITIPDLGTMTIECKLKGYNPIFIKSPFQVGKFEVQYCNEDNIIKTKKYPIEFYCGKLVHKE